MAQTPPGRLRRLSTVVPLVAALAVVGGCADKGDAGATASDGGAVEIVNFEFKPQVAEVAPGTTVKWTNADAARHTVKDRSSMAVPESPSLAQGETFTITYEEPGSFPYICGIHNYMTGTVEVS